MTVTETPREPSPVSRAGTAAIGTARPLLGAVSAEWVKFRSVRSTWWGLGLAFVLMVSVAAMAAGTTAWDMQYRDVPAGDLPASEMAIYGAVWVGQFVLIGIALTFVTSEYSSRSIHFSLQAVPRRCRLLAAKSVVLGSVVFASSLVFATAATLTVHLVMLHPLMGGYGTLVLSEAVVDVLRTAVFLTLISLLALGVGTAVRSAAAALTTVFLVILGLPVMMMMSGSELLFELYIRLPFTAGIAFLDSEFVIGPLEGMLSPTDGLVVLMVWAAAALGVGALVLNRRDA